MCERLHSGQGVPCPEGFPDDPALWCDYCRRNDELYRAECARADAAPEEPPCPLELHQQDAYRGWLDWNRLDWYFLHLGTPPRN